MQYYQQIFVLIISYFIAYIDTDRESYYLQLIRQRNRTSTNTYNLLYQLSSRCFRHCDGIIITIIRLDIAITTLSDQINKTRTTVREQRTRTSYTFLSIIRYIPSHRSGNQYTWRFSSAFPWRLPPPTCVWLVLASEPGEGGHFGESLLKPIMIWNHIGFLIFFQLLPLDILDRYKSMSSAQGHICAVCLVPMLDHKLQNLPMVAASREGMRKHLNYRYRRETKITKCWNRMTFKTCSSWNNLSGTSASIS